MNDVRGEAEGREIVGEGDGQAAELCGGPPVPRPVHNRRVAMREKPCGEIADIRLDAADDIEGSTRNQNPHGPRLLRQSLRKC